MSNSLSNRAMARDSNQLALTARGIDGLSSRLSRHCQADGGNDDRSNREGDIVSLRATEGFDFHRPLGGSCSRADFIWICMLYNEDYRAIAGRCWWVHLLLSLIKTAVYMSLTSHFARLQQD